MSETAMITTVTAGETRTFDDLGRIVIPKSIRKALNIHEGDQFDVIQDGDIIKLVRCVPACLACDDDTDVQRMNKTFLCGECRDAVSKTLVEKELDDDDTKK
ncbi:MAG: AbrB/MazE/SpoVT family DNA-binding domain-containing protein [Defluviitaleaceae bacterium]|nr:AbrB/MazE/SpoVT family DNA-binding domain-containing protein [Defluviitaleaceae bacterium]